MIFTFPPQCSQRSRSMRKTLFNRCAQVIATDGMYAGFAGAKTGHGSMPFAAGWLFDGVATRRGLDHH